MPDRLELFVELAAEVVEQVVFLLEEGELGIEAVDEMVAGHGLLALGGARAGGLAGVGAIGLDLALSGHV
jgi:hypothetical protein